MRDQAVGTNFWAPRASEHGAWGVSLVIFPRDRHLDGSVEEHGVSSNVFPRPGIRQGYRDTTLAIRRGRRPPELWPSGRGCTAYPYEYEPESLCDSFTIS